MVESAAPANRALEPRIPHSETEKMKAGQRALRAAFMGFFVDMFDVYLPIVALGPAMSYFQPATLSPALQSTLYFIVFALSLVGRPVGATLFGHYGDRFGRRKITLLSMGGFAVVTLLIGLLPGYQTWGIGSIGLLAFLRLVDGIFLGGEYTGANPLAMEYAPKESRGMWSAIIQAGFPVAMAAMSLITTGLLRLFPAEGIDSPYVRWGWRIPFFLGALLAGGVFAYYFRVPESEVWASSEKSRSPLKELFRGENFRRLAQIFVVMSGIWFTLNAITSILPGVLVTIRHVRSVVVTDAQIVANIILTAVFILVGVIGQKFGRRVILIAFGLSACTLGPFLYFVLIRSRYQSATEVIAMVAAVNLCVTPVWAVLTAYITERFPTSVRASGFGVGYSAATIIPAFSSFYMLGLKGLGVPYAYTEIVILALGGFLLVAGALWGPETKHVNI
jgi:MFS family permease